MVAISERREKGNNNHFAKFGFVYVRKTTSLLGGVCCSSAEDCYFRTSLLCEREIEKVKRQAPCF